MKDDIKLNNILDALHVEKEISKRKTTIYALLQEIDELYFTGCFKRDFRKVIYYRKQINNLYNEIADLKIMKHEINRQTRLLNEEPEMFFD